MDMGIKIVTHAGMRMSTDIFSNCGYEGGDYSTLAIAISEINTPPILIYKTSFTKVLELNF
jgi:hypothetical protein